MSSSAIQYSGLVHDYNNTGLDVTPTHLPSFADKTIALDHSYDQQLAKLFNRIKFWNSYGDTRINFLCHSDYYNPQPEKELNRYEKYLYNYDKKNIFLRNNLFLSRVHIANAKMMQLAEQFAGKDKIRILDLGCGLSCSLIGMLAYFGEERVEYVGVDIDSRSIDENTKAYGDFSNVSFQTKDAIDLLTDPDFAQKFDLVLLQHPNFQDKPCREPFTKIFINAKKALNDGGIVYSTIFTKMEADYFSNNVLPQLSDAGNWQLKQSNLYNDKNLHYDSTGQQFMPEQYVLISPPFPWIRASTERK